MSRTDRVCSRLDGEPANLFQKRFQNLLRRTRCLVEESATVLTIANRLFLGVA
jgi:hypothetical protein